MTDPHWGITQLLGPGDVVASQQGAFLVTSVHPLPEVLTGGESSVYRVVGVYYQPEPTAYVEAGVVISSFDMGWDDPVLMLPAPH